jgi:hypothetical protein
MCSSQPEAGVQDDERSNLQKGYILITTSPRDEPFFAVCRYYAVDSWFEGRLTRGLREIFTLLGLGGCTLDVRAAAAQS